MPPKISTAGLLVMLMAAAILPAAEAQHAFATCRHDRWVLEDDRWLWSRCEMDHNAYLTSVLDASKCFGQRNGQLIKEDEGWFTRYCANCRIEPNSLWLACECYNNNGDWVLSKLDLNDHLTNLNGQVCCRTKKGKVCSEEHD